MQFVLFATVFLAVGLLALLVRWMLRVPPGLVPGNLAYAHVPTPLARDAALEIVADTLDVFPVGRVDHGRGVVILDATSRAVAARFAAPGQRLRTFGHWVFLVFRPLPDDAGTDVAVGVQRKWFEFGRGAAHLRTAVRDATVRALWATLPPPPRPDAGNDGDAPPDADTIPPAGERA